MSFLKKFLPDPIKLQWTCGDVSQEEDNNYMFSCHCYVGSIHLIMGLQSFNLAPGPSGKKTKKKQPTEQKNAQTENHLSARWHQWSKKVKAHPAPLFCSFISDNTLPLFLLFSKPTTHLFFSFYFLLNLFLLWSIPRVCRPSAAISTALPRGFPTLSANACCSSRDWLQPDGAHKNDIPLEKKEGASRPNGQIFPEKGWEKKYLGRI